MCVYVCGGVTRKDNSLEVFVNNAAKYKVLLHVFIRIIITAGTFPWSISSNLKKSNDSIFYSLLKMVPLVCQKNDSLVSHSIFQHNNLNK